MSVHLRTSHFIYEVGSGDFFISFFDTIEVRLTRGFFGKKYPTVLTDLYNGKLPFEKLDVAEKELKNIRKRLAKIPPSKLIWDKTDLSKKPPWGTDISEEITNLSNYFITSGGFNLFDVIEEVIETARNEKTAIIVE